MTIAVVFAAAFAISGAAQSGAPAVAFPKPDRPVADIVPRGRGKGSTRGRV